MRQLFIFIIVLLNPSSLLFAEEPPPSVSGRPPGSAGEASAV